MIHHLQAVSPDCLGAKYLHMSHHLQSVCPDCLGATSRHRLRPKTRRCSGSSTLEKTRTIRSAFTASPEDDARPKLVVKKRECYPDPVRHVCQVRIIIWKIYTSVQEFHHPQPGTNVNNNTGESFSQSEYSLVLVFPNNNTSCRRLKPL